MDQCKNFESGTLVLNEKPEYTQMEIATDDGG